MRLSCSVDLHNRACAALGVATACKPTHAQVSLGKKPGAQTDLFLMIATTKDLNGRKFEIKGNVLKVFVRCVAEGKATIQLKEPGFDVRLSKADPNQLKTFLSALKLAHDGEELDKDKISMLAPATIKAVEKPVENLSVLAKKDYPITHGFPSSLKRLEIKSCKLTRVDRRVLNLQHLTYLDLSSNSLRQLPSDFDRLTRLRELRLEHNELTDFPASLCLGPWQKSLKIINLSDNKLEGCALPLQLGLLCGLVRLVLDTNGLTALPPSIGNLCLLRLLKVANNKLTLLPASAARLRLQEVDLSDNNFDFKLIVGRRDNQAVNNQVLAPVIAPAPFVAPGLAVMVAAPFAAPPPPAAAVAGPAPAIAPPAQLTHSVPNLIELAGKLILKQSIPFSPETIPRNLCWYLQYFSKRCICGGFCFESAIRATASLDLHSIATTCTTDSNGGTVPMLAFLCSPKCFNKFKKNPMAFSV